MRAGRVTAHDGFAVRKRHGELQLIAVAAAIPRGKHLCDRKIESRTAHCALYRAALELKLMLPRYADIGTAAAAERNGARMRLAVRRRSDKLLDARNIVARALLYHLDLSDIAVHSVLNEQHLSAVARYPVAEIADVGYLDLCRARRRALFLFLLHPKNLPRCRRFSMGGAPPVLSIITDYARCVNAAVSQAV